MLLTLQMIARYQWKLVMLAKVSKLQCRDILLIDGNDDVIIIKDVLTSGPILDRVVVDSTAPFRVLSECLKEVRVEEEHPIYRHFELIVKVSDTVSESCVFQIALLTRGRS